MKWVNEDNLKEMITKKVKTYHLLGTIDSKKLKFHLRILQLNYK